MLVIGLEFPPADLFGSKLYPNLYLYRHFNPIPRKYLLSLSEYDISLSFEYVESTLFLLMVSWRYEPVHQQAYYWPRFEFSESWWRHQMETFSALLAICAGNSPAPVNSPHKGQWRGALMFSLICVWINSWVNNGEADDLRRYRAHHDDTVIILRVLCRKDNGILS